MIYEARITVHQDGNRKPDYDDIHNRMVNVGYLRQWRLLQELHGMYRKTSLADIDTEKSIIQRALQPTGFKFSIELFHIDATRTFNLEPASGYGDLLGLYSLTGRR